MKFILRLNEISKNSITDVGPKIAYLGEFFDEVKIPSGFVILGNVLVKELDNLIGDKIDNMISSINFLNDSEVQSFANNLQKKIVFTEFSEKLEYQLKLAYQSINYSKETVAEDLLKEDNTLVAVRTSFNNPHELPKKSIQRVNYLNIYGEDRFLKSIKTSLASLFLKDMLKYYHANDVNWRDIKFSILVQEMIDSEKSGQAMTYIPEKINKDVIQSNNILVLSVFGLGECLSGGFVEPDVSLVDPNTNRLIFRNTGNQNFIYTLDKEKMKTAKVDLGEKGKQQILNDKEVERVARLAKRIKKKFSSDVVIEWAIYEDRIYVLQITPRDVDEKSRDFTEYQVKNSLDISQNESPDDLNQSTTQSEEVSGDNVESSSDEKLDVKNKKTISDKSEDNLKNNQDKKFSEDNQKTEEINQVKKQEINQKEVDQKIEPETEPKKTNPEEKDSKELKENKKNIHDEKDSNFDPLEEISKQEITEEDLSKKSKSNTDSNINDNDSNFSNDNEDDELVEKNISVFNNDEMKKTPVGKEEIDINEILEIYDKTVSDNVDVSNSNSSNNSNNRNNDENKNKEPLDVKNQKDSNLERNPNINNNNNDNINNNNNNNNNKNNQNVDSSSNMNDRNDIKEDEKKEDKNNENKNSEFLLSNIKSDLDIESENKNNNEDDTDLDILINIKNKIKKELTKKLNKDFENYSLLDISENMEGLLTNELKAGLKKVHSLIKRAKSKKEISPKDISVAYKVLLKVREFKI